MLLLRMAFGVVAILVVLPGPIVADGREGSPLESPVQAAFMLRSSVVGAGGVPGETGKLKTNGTLAQPLTPGKGTTATKNLYAGFWSKPWVLSSVLGDEGTGPFVDRLYQNFPNPFVSSTTIAFSLAGRSNVKVAIYNIVGQKVATLAGGPYQPGRHILRWDATDRWGNRVSPGVYFYRLQAGSYGSAKKLLVLE
jgi:hypothetical protein